VRLRIEKAIYGGAGLARAEGQAVFVPLTLPGEEIEAHLTETRRGYATAELDSVLEASAARVQAPCPYFGACGGCHYQHAHYAAQVEIKAAILQETLERAKIREIPAIVPITGEPFGYRNRVRLHVQRKPFALCYKRRGSHVNLPVATCPIAAPGLQQALAILTAEGERLGLVGWVSELELFTNQDESAMMLALWTGLPAPEAERALTKCGSELLQVLPTLAGISVFAAEKEKASSRVLAHEGEATLHYRVGGREYRVTAGSFFQVNRFLIDGLVQIVTEDESGAAAWDLYAGVGLFSLPMGERFAEVTAVESSGAAVHDLRENLRGTRHHVVAAETVDFLRRAARQRGAAPDLVVVDPPRAGLGREVTTLLGKMQPRNITYVSCDPATLSRDLVALVESGYRLRKMHLVDLFPQTFHLESVTHLSLA
jgi:23S rRNA (uracil1939-C5)-methyltransferase